MGFWTFLTGKQDTGIDLSRYPEAVSLAERHSRECNSLHDDTAVSDGSSLAEGNGVSLQVRHDAELEKATAYLTQIEVLRFKTAYHQKLAAEIEANTKTLQDKFAAEHPAEQEALNKAKVIAAAIEAGDEAPQWATDAYQMGLRDGQLRFTVDESVRYQLISEQLAALEGWLATLPEDAQALARLVHGEGSATGGREGATKLVASQSALSKSSFWDQQIHLVQFLAGDLGVGKGHVLASGKVRIPSGTMDFAIRAIASIEVANEESVTRVGGAVGWGVAGATLLGPAGLIAGSLLGGRGKDVTFVATLRDGKRFLARASSKVYEQFLSATFG